MANKPLHILLVEDDADDAALFGRTLASRGAQMEVAPRLSEALAKLSNGKRFDVVVTDLGLPDSDGFDTVARLRAQAPHLPLVVLTGRDDDAMATSSVKEGAEDYLVKGEQGPGLFRTLRNAIERRRSREEIEQLAQALAAQNEQMMTELETARDVQKALLPRGLSFVDGRVKIHQRFLPTQAVGGDLYVLIPSATDETALVIFDVMGHGVRAALVASTLRALVSELPFQPHDPAQLLGHLNRRLRRIFSEQQLFATAFCVVLKPVTESMRYASAGHPLPWRISPLEQTIEPMPVAVGPPLGLIDEPEYSTAARPLDAGERVMLFTDGLYEVTDPQGSLLGRKGLEAMVLKHAKERTPAEVFADKLLADVEAFTGRKTFDDDVCIVLAEVCE
jgi:sigma-B regulation protein RsbU (phosphoserine phosphatase)